MIRLKVHEDPFLEVCAIENPNYKPAIGATEAPEVDDDSENVFKRVSHKNDTRDTSPGDAVPMDGLPKGNVKPTVKGTARKRSIRRPSRARTSHREPYLEVPFRVQHSPVSPLVA